MMRMKARWLWASVSGAMFVAVGCQGPLDGPLTVHRSLVRDRPSQAKALYDETNDELSAAPLLDASSELTDYVRYAALHNPGLEASFQRWRAAVERAPQVGAMPDPRFTVGVYLQEVETRTGPQQGRVGLSQRFPAFGLLRARKDAASRAALAQWRRFEGERLALGERVKLALFELRFLDESIAITRENLRLLEQFERVLQARYRVGIDGHPEVIRVQVELGKVEDRARQLEHMRTSFVARLNAELNRPGSAVVATIPALPLGRADTEAEALVRLARHQNPTLLAMDEEVESLRDLTKAARKEGLPDVTVGLDYIVTDDARMAGVAGSGDDPVMVSFSFNLPLSREKYDAGVREQMAKRLATSMAREEAANRIGAEIERQWFEHTDADRRVTLFERTLIPKATQSLEASLASFRAGNSSFLDLLETQRTLLDFELEAKRSRTNRAIALARLETLVGSEIDVKEPGS